MADRARVYPTAARGEHRGIPDRDLVAGRCARGLEHDAATEGASRAIRFRECHDAVHGDRPRPPITVNGRPRWRSAGSCGRRGWRICWALIQLLWRLCVIELLAVAVVILEHARLAIGAGELVAQGLALRTLGATEHAAELRACAASGASVEVDAVDDERCVVGHYAVVTVAAVLPVRRRSRWGRWGEWKAQLQIVDGGVFGVQVPDVVLRRGLHVAGCVTIVAHQEPKTAALQHVDVSFFVRFVVAPRLCWLQRRGDGGFEVVHHPPAEG